MQVPRLKITSSTPTSVGDTKTNIVGLVIQHAFTNENTGGLTVPCDLKWWLSATSYDSNKDLVWPENASGVKIASIQFELTQQEALAANLPITIYEKAAEALENVNPGMTVVVEVE